MTPPNKKQTPKRGERLGAATNNNTGGALIFYPQYSTPQQICNTKEPIQNLMDQADRRMTAAEASGNVARYIAHFSIWIELHALARRSGR